MTGRQTLIDRLLGRKTDRVPVVLFSAGAWTFNSLGLPLEAVIGNADVMATAISQTFLTKAPSDAVWVGSGFNNLPVRILGGEIVYPRQGTPRVTRTAFADASDLVAIDADRIALDPHVRSLWETTARVKKALGSQTMIGACGWGPFTLAGQMYGTEKLMSGIYKDPASVRRVLDFSVDASSCYYRGFMENGAEIISIAEPIASGDMISRRHFETFVAPVVKEFLDRLKGPAVYNLLHICGNITNRLDLIPPMGVDALSVDYKVDLKKVRSAIGTRIAFAGNVNPADVLQQGTPEDVIAASHRCISDAGDDSNFILMPGCDIPPSVPLQNIRAFFSAPASYCGKGVDQS
ncbi:MAG: uroporphyrinogen decarboxylase family protein [Syntrophorhabdales bacterium]|jgi:uroporphyrinogen decarboxylase